MMDLIDLVLKLPTDVSGFVLSTFVGLKSSVSLDTAHSALKNNKPKVTVTGIEPSPKCNNFIFSPFSQRSK